MSNLSQFLSSGGGGKLRYQDFTSSGTFTPSAALLANGGQCYYELIGGGSSGSIGTSLPGIGGNAGEYKTGVITVTGPVTVTIGAGGAAVASVSGTIAGNAGSASSIGALATAAGGAKPPAATANNAGCGGRGAGGVGYFTTDTSSTLDARGGVGVNGRAGGGGGTATRILSPRGSVIFETRTNQLFVNDIPSKLEEIQGMIAKIDIPVRQVLIEARIVEASDTFGRSLGVRLGALDMRGLRGGTPGFGVGNDNRIAITGTYQGVGEQTLQAAATSGSYTPNTYFVNLPSTGFNGYTASSVALSLFGASSNRFLNLELSALEADGKGKIVSSPRVITADQVKALIEQGTELPYQVATSSGATALAFRKANLKLEVTPQITPEGNIILDVDVNKDSVGQVTNAGYAIDTKHVQTQVLVENGGTVVIGGIFLQSENSTETKVPFLGDLPVLGHLFKSNVRNAQRSELLIFLTPKVVTEKAALR